MTMLKLSVVLLSLYFVTTNCQDVTKYNGDILPSFISLISDILPDYLNSTVLMSLQVNTLLAATDLIFDNFLPPPELPVLDEDIWWGEDRVEEDTSIREFSIKFDETNIQRLKNKINDRETFTESLIDSNSGYGLDIDILNDLVDRWANEYDFEGRQDFLNQFPQYKTQVQGLDIHYYHIKPQNTSKTVIPILMIHGFPVSNIEYIHLFSSLSSDSDDYDFVFEIIAPSVPGYGYSQATSKIGLNPYNIAIIFKKLMNRLGHDKFYMHSGDIGQIICTDLMTIYPDNVLGYHTNLGVHFMPKTLTKWLISSLYPPSVVEEQYSDRMFPLSTRLYYYMNGFGYFHEQSTKPDTIGVATQDSPSALASWIGSLFYAAARNNVYDGEAGIFGEYNVTDLYDVLTVFWDSKSIVTSMRYYSELVAWFQDSKQWEILGIPTNAPFAVTKCLFEIIYMPDEFLMDKYPNLVHSTTLDFGTHFIGYEQPELFASLIRDAVNAMIEFNNSK